MHPTADTLLLIFGNHTGRRVMPGVRLLSQRWENSMFGKARIGLIFLAIVAPFLVMWAANAARFSFPVIAGGSRNSSPLPPRALKASEPALAESPCVSEIGRASC